MFQILPVDSELFRPLLKLFVVFLFLNGNTFSFLQSVTGRDDTKAGLTAATAPWVGSRMM